MSIKDLVRFRNSGKLFLLDEKKRMAQLEATGQARDPNDVRVRAVTPRAGSTTAGQFEDPDVDLIQIGQAYHSDAYISRAVNKIVGSMFKAGWHLSSLNKEALTYVQTRFRLMEESTDVPTEELLRELGKNYVLYANAPIIKTRGQENLADLTAEGYYGGEPLSGLFAGNPEAFQVLRDETGNVENYSFGVGADVVELPTEDVNHLTYHKPTGRAYGVPYITNTLRDVLILRQVEETVTNILYRNLHPLQTYTVGKATAGFEAREGEIEEVEEAIRGASLDSMFVIPERHAIQTVSSSSDFLDASAYLKYFRQRVFTGLGVSESTMGIGDSSNRSTSDNQSSDLIDLVKDFQQNFSAEFQKIVNELLFEGGYDPTLNEDDRVTFVFTEIEQSAKIARENHELQKFSMNVQGLNQTRNNIGYEPTDDLSDFYYQLVKGGTIVDREGSVQNQNQPENQHGRADGPTKDSMKDGSRTTNVTEHVDLHSKNHKFGNKETDLRLTTQELVVTVPTDEVSFSDSKQKTIEKQLTISWKQSAARFDQVADKSKGNLINTIEGGFSESLFDEDHQRAYFIRLLVETAYHLTEEWSPQKRDNLYKFEAAVIKSYWAITKPDKGGMA